MEKERDYEWVSKEILHWQVGESEALKRLNNAKTNYGKAKTELDEAEENYKGVRGCLEEMLWQLGYYKEHGKLP